MNNLIRESQLEKEGERRRIMCKKFSVISLAIVILIALAVPGCTSNDQQIDQVIVIDTRPFAINPETYYMNPDGIFDIALDDQIIGVYLKNTGTSTITNVQAMLTFPPGSGITVTKNTESFGDLSPNVPVLGFFRASLGNSAPNKYNLTLDIAGDGFSGQATRKIFVAKSHLAVEDAVGVVEVPEGSISLDTNSLTFFEGTNLMSALAPTYFTWTMVPSAPFSGQFSELPFSDPLWKLIGVALIGASGGWITGRGIDKVCKGQEGGDVLIAEGVGILGGGLLAVGILTTASDIKDPFRWGEENTFPQPHELTTKEVVEVSANYLDEPIVGTPYSVAVNWTFTRYTTGNTYNYSVSQVVTNEHFTTSRSIAANQVTYVAGDKIIITAEILGGNGVPLSGADAFVYAKIDTELLNLINIVMRDDGHEPDLQASDGVYTGGYSIQPSDPVGTWDIYVFAQDVNRAGENEAPLITAQEIGGMLVSLPSSTGCTIDPDCTTTVTSPDGVFGGIVVPVNKFALLAPWIALASIILVATAVYFRRVRHGKEEQ